MTLSMTLLFLIVLFYSSPHLQIEVKLQVTLILPSGVVKPLPLPRFNFYPVGFAFSMQSCQIFFIFGKFKSPATWLESTQ